MTMPLGRSYRLVARGGPGLACDKDGVTLGVVELARARLDAAGVRRCEVRPPDDIVQVLRAAYGPQPDEVVQRLHRGLRRAAAWIEVDDLGRAGVEAVMLGLPDLTPGAMAKLAGIADIEKGGAAWENEPRIPAGQPGGGRWTTDDGGALTADVKPSGDSTPAASPRRERLALPLDDGVYRPGVNDPVLIPTGGADEDEEPRAGSNGPPDDFTSLEEVFPGLKDAPGLAIPLAPVDGFLGISALADAANLGATMLRHRALIAQIKAVDPGFADKEILPAGGIAGLSWQGRANLLNSLRMQRAAAFYKMRGDVGPLQVETLRFLQDAIDRAYAEGVEKYDAGRLQPRLSRQEAIGNYVDVEVREELQALFNRHNISYGPRQNITINSRDYDSASSPRTFRIPDARVGDISFDWTLTLKTIASGQIRGFFFADAKPVGVIIVRPSQLKGDSIYFIPRPANLRKVIIDVAAIQTSYSDGRW
jgi:hypothetical protein